MNPNTPPDPFSHPVAGALVPVTANLIRPCRYQPRPDLDLDDADFQRLMQSIERHGIIHPPVVRRLEGGAYELVAGRRRLAAWIALGRGDMLIAVMTIDATDDEVAMLAYVENDHRKGSRWWDRAQHVGRMRDRWRAGGWEVSGVELAALLAVSEALISQQMTVYEALPESVWAAADLDEGQVRCLPKETLIAISDLDEAERPEALRAAVAALLEPVGEAKVRRRYRQHDAYRVQHHLDGSTSHRIHPDRLSEDERTQAIHDLDALLTRLRRGEDGSTTLPKV